MSRRPFCKTFRNRLLMTRLLKTRTHVKNRLGVLPSYMMGKNFAKKIANLNKVPHPQGRKTAQILKKTFRANGRLKVKLQHQMKLNVLGEKIMWFKNNLNSVDSCTPELIINVIERYLRRFDEELEQIRLKHATGKRKGRQHANREDIISMTIKNERNEFLTSGIEMPDVLNSKQLSLLKNWNGELRYLQNFKLVRYTKGKLESMRCLGKNDPEEETDELDADSNEKETEPEKVEKQESPSTSSLMIVDS